MAKNQTTRRRPGQMSKAVTTMQHRLLCNTLARRTARHTRREGAAAHLVPNWWTRFQISTSSFSVQSPLLSSGRRWLRQRSRHYAMEQGYIAVQWRAPLIAWPAHPTSYRRATARRGIVHL